MTPTKHMGSPDPRNESFGQDDGQALQKSANSEHGRRKSDLVTAKWNIYNENIPLAGDFSSLRKPRSQLARANNFSNQQMYFFGYGTVPFCSVLSTNWLSIPPNAVLRRSTDRRRAGH